MSVKRAGAAPISFADLEVAAAKVATRKSWLRTKIGASKVESGGQAIADRFGADWNITLNRDDATGPDPEGRLPAPDAPVEEIKVMIGIDPLVPLLLFMLGCVVCPHCTHAGHAVQSQ